MANELIIRGNALEIYIMANKLYNGKIKFIRYDDNKTATYVNCNDDLAVSEMTINATYYVSVNDNVLNITLSDDETVFSNKHCVEVCLCPRY